MPRKCCFPTCEGNYSSVPKVSVFRFPRDEDLREKWIKAIHGDGFLLSKESVACQLHFQSTDIARSTSMYDRKTGSLLTEPLEKPRKMQFHLCCLGVPHIYPDLQHQEKILKTVESDSKL